MIGVSAMAHSMDSGDGRAVRSLSVIGRQMRRLRVLRHASSKLLADAPASLAAQVADDGVRREEDILLEEYLAAWADYDAHAPPGTARPMPVVDSEFRVLAELVREAATMARAAPDSLAAALALSSVRERQAVLAHEFAEAPEAARDTRARHVAAADVLAMAASSGGAASYEDCHIHGELDFGALYAHERSSGRGRPLPCLRFAGCRFDTRLRCEGVVVAAADFQGAVFDEGASFARASFKGDATFAAASFADHGGFRECTFDQGATFEEATFGDADFDSAVFSNVTFAGATFGVARFPSVRIAGSGDFARTAFATADFMRSRLGSVAFDSAAFHGASVFDDCHAERISFEEASLGPAFSLKNCALGSATFDLADSRHTCWLSGSRFDAARFNGVRLRDVNLAGAVFRGPAHFVSAALEEAEFRGVTFAASANFEYAEIGIARFDRAVLQGIVFRDATVRDISFADSTLYDLLIERCGFAGRASFDRAAIHRLAIAETSFVTLPSFDAPHYWQPTLARALRAWALTYIRPLRWLLWRRHRRTGMLAPRGLSQWLGGSDTRRLLPDSKGTTVQVDARDQVVSPDAGFLALVTSTA